MFLERDDCPTCSLLQYRMSLKEGACFQYKQLTGLRRSH